MKINQRGDPIEETELIFGSDFEDAHEMGQALLMLIHRMGLELWRTNATKHGDTQLQLREPK